MTNILQERMRENHSQIALIADDVHYSFGGLLKSALLKMKLFSKAGLGPDSVVVILGDFSFNSIASLLACIFCKATVVPLTKEAQSKLQNEINLLKPDFIINTFDNDNLYDVSAEPNFERGNWRHIIPADGGGLIVFTSGSTGTPKAIVHSMDALCYRYMETRSPLISICFLQFDHMGGLNTLLSLLFRGGTAVRPSSRQADAICSAVEKYNVQLLPTTPSFLTQLLISKSANKYDLSSLKVISYGTEVMNESVLTKLNELLPFCTFKQTYGLSETGVFQIRSKANDSVWFEFKDKGLEYKIKDDVLWIKTKSNLIGKLVFDDKNISMQKHSDEWFCTDDLVDVDGDYLKIKSRSSDIINVGGLKVYPSEVENCILQLEIIEDVTVVAKKNILLGEMVVAHVRLELGSERDFAEKAIRLHCNENLEKFKVPTQIKFDNREFINDRFKKVRVE